MDPDARSSCRLDDSIESFVLILMLERLDLVAEEHNNDHEISSILFSCKSNSNRISWWYLKVFQNIFSSAGFCDCTVFNKCNFSFTGNQAYFFKAYSKDNVINRLFAGYFIPGYLLKRVVSASWVIVVGRFDRNKILFITGWSKK